MREIAGINIANIEIQSQDEDDIVYDDPICLADNDDDDENENLNNISDSFPF